MTDLDRYLLHPASTATGATSWLDNDRPLGAGRHQSVVGSNLLRLGRANCCRPLFSHPGVRGIWRPARDPVFSGHPVVGDLNWTFSPKDGGIAIDLGTHWVWRYATDTRWPQVVLTLRAAVENSGDTLGTFFGITPGERFLVERDPHDTELFTTTSYTTKRYALSLSEESLERMEFTPLGGTGAGDPDEHIQLYRFRAWLGGYNTSNANTPGRLAHVLGISLGLEPP